MAKSSKGRKKAAAKKPAPARRRTAGAKSAKKAAKKAPARAAARKGPAKKAAKKAVKAAARKAPARRVVARKAAPKKAPSRKTAAKKVLPKKVLPKKTLPKKASAKPVATKKAAAPRAVARKAAPAPKAVVRKAAVAAPAPKPVAAPKAARPAPGLNRERRTVRETPPPSAPSTLGAHRHASAASSGADELRVKLASHTGDGPAITAGDVDANWEGAESVGDEAPGGDNPTPDQDVVDEIGRALGVEYDDDEELQGGDEIAARDHNRWELDPASSDDFDER